MNFEQAVKALERIDDGENTSPLRPAAVYALKLPSGRVYEFAMYADQVRIYRQDLEGVGCENSPDRTLEQAVKHALKLDKAASRRQERKKKEGNGMV